MVLVNGGYLHCTDKEFLVNSSLKGTKKMAREISKTQVSDPGPSWPSCFFLPQYFLSFPRQISIFLAKFNWSSANAFSLDQSKNSSFGKDKYASMVVFEL